MIAILSSVVYLHILAEFFPFPAAVKIDVVGRQAELRPLRRGVSGGFLAHPAPTVLPPMRLGMPLEIELGVRISGGARRLHCLLEDEFH